MANPFREPGSITQALDDLVYQVSIAVEWFPAIEIRMPLVQLNRVTAAIDKDFGGYDLRRVQLKSPDGVFMYNGIRFVPRLPESLDPGEFAEGFALSG